jgi:hypothetical protein
VADSAPRPKDVITALARLDYIELPRRRSQGDHQHLSKHMDHPANPRGVTLKTHVDTGQKKGLSKHDVSCIKRQTCLQEGGMWEQMLDGDLSQEDYDEWLQAKSLDELFPYLA